MEYNCFTNFSRLELYCAMISRVTARYGGFSQWTAITSMYIRLSICSFRIQQRNYRHIESNLTRYLFTCGAVQRSLTVFLRLIRCLYCQSCAIVVVRTVCMLLLSVYL